MNRDVCACWWNGTARRLLGVSHFGNQNQNQKHNSTMRRRQKAQCVTVRLATAIGGDDKIRFALGKSLIDYRLDVLERTQSDGINDVWICICVASTVHVRAIYRRLYVHLSAGTRRITAIFVSSLTPTLSLYV